MARIFFANVRVGFICGAGLECLDRKKCSTFGRRLEGVKENQVTKDCIDRNCCASLEVREIEKLRQGTKKGRRAGLAIMKRKTHKS